MKALKTMFLSCLVLGLCSVVASCSDDDDEVEVEVEEAAVLTVTYTDSTGTDLLTSGVSYNCEQADYPTTSIEIEANKGLASLTVGITGGNDAFQAVISDLGLSSIELVGGNATLTAAMTAFGMSFSAPASGDTSYSFPIYNFYALMSLYGITDSGSYHQFAIKVTDAQANTTSATLKVTITEDDYSLSVVYEDEDGTDLLTNGLLFNDAALDYPTTSVEIAASKGLASITVGITGGNDAFQAIISDTGLSSIDLLDSTDAATLSAVMSLFGLSFTAPSSGDTSYEFPISNFYQLVAMYGATDADSAHTFDITVTDARGHSTSASLSVQVCSVSVTYEDEDGTDLLAKGLTIDASEGTYPTTSAIITATEGISSILVNISGGNDLFNTSVSYMGLSSIELVGSNNGTLTLSDLMGGNLSLPSEGDTSYEFPIYGFYETLLALGDTDEGKTHTFDIVVTDLSGHTYTGTLNITVTGTATSDGTEEGTSSAVSITYASGDTDYLTSGVSFSASTYNYPTASVVISAEAGLASVTVTVTAGNSALSTYAAMMSNMELVGGNSTLDMVMGMMGATMTYPTAGDTTYEFPIYNFYTMLAALGTTDSGSAHVFAVTATDANGESTSASISVTVTE